MSIHNYFSILPKELFTIIFSNLEPKDQSDLIYTNKKINELVSLEYLKNLRIEPDSAKSPYVQVLDLYKNYCNFFVKKIPALLNSDLPNTIIDRKQSIDIWLRCDLISKTSLYSVPKSFLDESWSRFVIKLAPFCSGCSPFELQPDERFNDLNVLNPDEEVKWYLRAGVSQAKLSCIIETVMKQKWCSEETMQLLTDHKFTIDVSTVYTALKSDKFNKFALPLIRNCEANSLNLSLLFNSIPPEHELLINEYIDKYMDVLKVDEDAIQYGINNKHSDKVLIKILQKCTEVNDYIVRKAIESDYSEDFIRELVKKSSTNLSDYHFRIAIGKYSLNLIEKIYNKTDPLNPIKLKASTVEWAMHKYNKPTDSKPKYDYNLIDFMVSHVEEDEMTESLESIIKYGPAQSYESIINKYLSKANDKFSHYVFNHLILNRYSEELILKIVDHMVDPNYIKFMTITDDQDLFQVMALYSHKILRIILNHEEGTTRLDSKLIKIALDQDYPEDLLIKMVDMIYEVQLVDLKKARQKSYSSALINKMTAKCYEKENCILS